MITINDKRILKYFIPPPIVTSVVEYQNVNKDGRLRKNVTDFFLKKSIKWIEDYKEFKHLENKLEILKSNKGYNVIYNLLREFINKGSNNWFDLRENYDVIKDYLRYKLGKI